MTGVNDARIREGRLTEGERTDLERAEALELELRQKLAGLVTERRRTAEEITRLEGRAGRPGADPSLAGTAARYRARAQELERELDDTRRRLRAQEGTVATLRADRDLSPAASPQPEGDA